MLRVIKFNQKIENQSVQIPWLKKYYFIFYTSYNRFISDKFHYVTVFLFQSSIKRNILFWQTMTDELISFIKYVFWTPSFVHLFFCLFVHLPVCSFVHLFICLFFHLSVFSFVCFFICLFFHLSVFSFVCFFICLFFHLSIFHSSGCSVVHLLIRTFVHSSICWFVRLFIYPYVHLPFVHLSFTGFCVEEPVLTGKH